MKLEYVCPTLNRSAGLARLQETVDGPLRVWHESGPRPLPVIYREMLASSNADVCVILADHLVVQSGCRAALELAFELHFPDLDGVVGLNRTNVTDLVRDGVNYGIYGHVAIGRGFMDRFVDRQCHCPDYDHFYSDTELGLYAQGEGRFQYAEGAKVFTYHPNVGNVEADATHVASRVHRATDDAMWRARRERGLLWGKTFELLGRRSRT